MRFPNLSSGNTTLVCSLVALTSLAVTSVEAQTWSHPSLRAIQAKQAQKRAEEQEREQQERERYKGITLKSDSEVTAVDRALQKQIAGILKANDLALTQRIEHYQWMSKNRYLKITGWYASISNVALGPNGMIVTLKVSPRHDCDGSFMTTSHTTERYLFANGKLTFLDLIYTGGVSTWN